MHYVPLTFLFCWLSFFSNDTAPSSPTVLKSIADNPAKADSVKTVAAHVLFQSKDGGKTWQDITHGLPEWGEPEGFFAGESELFVRINNEMYSSESNLKTPAWEKESGLDPKCTSIAFIRSGVIAYNYEGPIFQKRPSSETWLPGYENLKSQSMQTIFEASDGSVFLSTGRNLFKSADKARSWKLVQKGGGWDILESEGVLLATGVNGIMRSSDNGEHWEWVISEGGVGIAIERIEGGFAAITYSSRTESRRIHISMDSGSTWTAIDKGLPRSLSISSIKQMGEYLVCGHPDGIFRSSDMGKTWKIVHPSVDNVFMLTGLNNASRDNRKVFKIHASGNVLYAVAVNSGRGC